MNRILAIGALAIVILQLGGCLALLLTDKLVPGWLSHSAVGSVAVVVGVLGTLKAVRLKPEA